MQLAAHAPGLSPALAASRSAPTPPSCPAPLQRRCRRGLRGSREHGVRLLLSSGPLLCNRWAKHVSQGAQQRFPISHKFGPGTVHRHAAEAFVSLMETTVCIWHNAAVVLRKCRCLSGRPAKMMQVTTGVSSRDSASASTPPTDRVSPSFANSRTNWAQVERPLSVSTSAAHAYALTHTASCCVMLPCIHG